LERREETCIQYNDIFKHRQSIRNNKKKELMLGKEQKKRKWFKASNVCHGGMRGTSKVAREVDRHRSITV
jgi:hypothetical protein